MNDKFTRFIVGLDPGKSCGFATLNGDEFHSTDLTPLQACSELHRLLRNGRPKIVSAERYTFTQAASRMTRQYDALEIIGTARYLCHEYGVTFVINGAAEASRVGSPAVLRALGWWARGKDHRNKAAAQVALVLQQTHPEEFLERTHLAF